MVMKLSPWIAAVFVISAFAAHAADQPAPPTVEEAIAVVNRPAGTRGATAGGATPLWELGRRLRVLFGEGEYRFAEKDSEAWLACLRDAKRGVYTRLCAAYFLLQNHEEARNFVARLLVSQNIRHRFNAAETVRLHLSNCSERAWGVERFDQASC